MNVEGDLNCKGSIEVAGIMNGNILANGLKVLETGSIIGGVKAGRFEVFGFMENVIEVKNLSKCYGSFFWRKKVLALENLTLSIPSGAVFGFLGPNGAGKTTTIKLLMDLIKPTGGEAMVLGRKPEDVDIKKQIGFLPDAPAFSSYLTANEFL